MIELYFPNPKKVFLPHVYRQAALKKITAVEFERRQEIVVKHAQQFPHYVGSLVYPSDKTWFENVDQCRVTHICRNYADFGDDEWPSNDMPMIIGVMSLKTGERFHATFNFFTKEKPTFND